MLPFHATARCAPRQTSRAVTAFVRCMHSYLLRPCSSKSFVNLLVFHLSYAGHSLLQFFFMCIYLILSKRTDTFRIHIFPISRYRRIAYVLQFLVENTDRRIEPVLVSWTCLETPGRETIHGALP